MTVKAISEHDKTHLCWLYTSKTRTVKQLAGEYRTSVRTIGRVLEERGLATPVPRLKDEAYQAVLLLKKHVVSVSMLAVLLENTVTPEITAESVQQYLDSCPVSALTGMFVTSITNRMVMHSKSTKPVSETQPSATNVQSTEESNNPAHHSV